MLNNDSTIITTVKSAINTVCKKYDYTYNFPMYERDDLAGDILEHLCLVSDKYDPTISKVETWAFCIAVNYTISFLKKRFPGINKKTGEPIKSRRTRLTCICDCVSKELANCSEDTAYAAYISSHDDYEPSSYDSEGEHESYLKELSAKVQPHIEALSQLDRDLLSMTYYDGYSSKKISVLLNMTANNVNVKRHRIIERLKKNLGIKASSTSSNDADEAFFIVFDFSEECVLHYNMHEYLEV